MESFFSKSEKVQDIIKNFNLTKTLFVSSIIIGDAHTGKKTLARSLFPDAVVVSAVDEEKVKLAIESYDEIIITEFEKFQNQMALEFNNKRIIAIANYIRDSLVTDDLFAFIYTMPSLKNRPKDVHYLAQKFILEAQKNLLLEETPISLNDIPYSLVHNSKSLKKSIYQYLVKQSLDKHDLMDLIDHYLYNILDGNNNYEAHLELYEKPLITAGLRKYGSQLQLSQALGINRNTLRKKIQKQGIR